MLSYALDLGRTRSVACGDLILVRSIEIQAGEPMPSELLLLVKGRGTR